MTALSNTQSQALAAAGADNRFSGFSQEDLVMPQAHIVQGLPKEVEKYGDCKAGDVINTLTMEKLFSCDIAAKTITGDNRFIPICGWPEWVYWPKDEQRPVYRHRNKRDVPPDDLEWNDGPKGARIPPLATQCFVFIVLFTADPTTPLALIFKKTSVKAGQTILTLEKLRGRAGPGLYSMSFKRESNGQGSWIVPVIQPKGNPDADIATVALQMASSFSSSNIQIAGDDQVEAANDDPLAGTTSGTI